MKKAEQRRILFLLLNILFVASVMIWDLLYYDQRVTWRKGTASGMFVLLGAVNLVYAYLERAPRRKYPLVMVGGFVLGMLGDIVINYTFIPGAALFALGHVFYFIALCFLLPFQQMDAAVGGILAVSSVGILEVCPVFRFDGKEIEIICCVYAVIISMMLGKALSNLARERTLQNILNAIGCTLFYFSDLMLVFAWFSDVNKYADPLCLFTYYPAQCFLGLALFFTVPKRS